MSFLVYYGHDPAQIPRLRECEVLIFEPRGWSPEAVAQLKSPGGPLLLGYLSPLAWPRWAGPARWWWGPSSHDPQWKAHWYSLAWAGWRRKVRELAANVLQGCGGVFLDNLDRLEADPASLPHLLKILAELRRNWPGAYLLGNRGFANWDQLRPGLDGVLLENLADRAFSAGDRRWVEEQLRRCQGTDVYALDYATRCLDDEARRLCDLFPTMRYYRAPDESLQTLA